ncbi:MAG: hypothetical protein OXU42_11260 [Deltaproteobacteria bacterium]|nr:hypothetical protein [Deltaproteobacteria bacterium]
MADMGCTTGTPEPSDQLQSVLQAVETQTLERFAGFALGSLLGLPFRHARSGDQRGGDGGTSGFGDRHLVFEARRYKHSTRLDERSIRGEIDQAVERHPDLEAWILVTTQEVPEQVHDAIDRKAHSLGIGAIIIDWARHPLPRLAALAASSPDIFATESGQDLSALLAQIAQLSGYAHTLEAIQTELESWVIGFDAARNASHERVHEIWNSRRRAQAKFKQDVAGADDSAQHVSRPTLNYRLDAWLDGPDDGAVGALVGLDGVGKTWAAVDWLQLRLDRLPIVVLAPSSALGSTGTDTTSVELINFIARYLHDVSEVRDVSHWEKRVRRLLGRPVDHGPVFLIFFDGLNQLPSHAWISVLQQLEDDPFHQRTRTLISTRTTFFEDRLHRLQSLIASPHRITVENYDLNLGGEFDRKLDLAGLSRDDLPDHLVHHAAVPRMFDLIIQLRSQLGDVGDITVHRLLWAYGASAVQASSTGAFSEREWRRFLLELAADHKDGSHRSTVQRIEALSASTTRTPDQVYRRVSGVIDGIFTTLDQHGEPQFDPDFVSHALGLALVAQLENAGPGEQPTTVLDRFLDPIAGYDGRAETLRAAVSIALLKEGARPAAWLSTLCTRWLHSQNLPESHLSDLEILAPELVAPMLDVIEASCGHSLTTPRHLAITALATVDKTDVPVACAIAQRGVEWQSYISLEMRGNKSDRTEDSFHTQRCKRLRERVGTAEPGSIIVANREFQLVDYSAEDLIIAAAQLLQGRPLKHTVELFVRGAIHFALVGSGAAQETQSWLNALNTVDPEETAAALRSASKTIRSLTPAATHHPELNARIASILLWRTGYSEDAEEAWRTDPKIDHQLDYETDYLENPSRSFFRLERRHAASVLRDRTLGIFGRIERARDALLDPHLRIPKDFIDELASVSESFDFSRSATGRGRTPEDLRWERLSLALARCIPDRLADCQRARLRQYAERPTDQRFGSALAAPESVLLVGTEESKAIQALRERGDAASDEDEHAIQSNFLIAEIQSFSPIDQVTKIVNSNLDTLFLELGRACESPSRSELDHLVHSFCDDERMLSRLATVLAEHDLDLSQRSFDAFSRLLFSDDTDGAAATWMLLGCNDAERLGSLLERIGWSWSSSKPQIENIMGSRAITASNRGSSFSDFAARIAPAELLEALSQEERSREAVELAVDLLSAALFEYPGGAPESGLDIFHDHEAASTGNYNFTIGDLLEERDDENDVLSFFEGASRPEQYAQRRQAIIQSYVDAVRQARQSGAQLIHANFDAEDFDLVLDLYPEALKRWLQGMDPPTGEFRRRVQLAEGFFVGLCEAVLKRDPNRGVHLWRALQRCLRTRFIGSTGIDRMKYAPFASPSYPELDPILEQIYSLDECRTDEDLLDFVVAARTSDRVGWLQRMVSRDETSPCPAHRRRAVFLRPLLTRPSIAGDTDWPTGPPRGGYRETHDRSWIMGQMEAFAAHWLQEFVESDTPEAAYSSWLLFLACTDRRAKSWMWEIYDRYTVANGSIEADKRRFVEQQRHRLKRAVTDNEKSLRQTFASQRVTSSLLPWRAR